MATPDAPQVISRIPIPNFTLRGLSVDGERRRLFAADFSRIFMIDLSNPTQQFSSDSDNNGFDDRIIWTTSSSANGVTMDAARGLLYVPSGTGLDIWAVYDNCCDLQVDLSARAKSRQVGDRNTLLAKEKLGLQTAIAKGLVDGSCGAVTMLEQGSGACLWKSNPASACAENYQPGLSDHDFEVFVANPAAPGVKTCIDKLTEQFFDPVTKAPKEITLSTGGTITFEDVTFFPVSKTEFESAKLNIDRPTGSGGSDNVGDIGLGRQQLLLKWLLEGEYINVPGMLATGKPLEEILTTLRTSTRIPRSEGYEWANLMLFNLAKAKVYLRIGGATSGDSAFYDFNIKQLHDAGKAGIRATMARMVASGPGNAFVLDITRDRYNTNACRYITPLTTNPASWAQKPCGSFEEYVSSAAARSLLANPALGLFTTSQVLNDVNRFYRVKSDLDRILSDAQADEFIRRAHAFVSNVKAQTQPAFGGEPDEAQRLDNINFAQGKTTAARASVTVTVVPHVANKGFRGGDNLRLQFFEALPSAAASQKAELNVTLPGGDEQYPDFQRNADGTLKKDADGKAIPLFVLGPIDVTQNLGQLGHIAFSIDLPNPKMREADRTNNVFGTFFYALDTAGTSSPALPASVPTPPGLGSLAPDAECNDAPPLRITERVLIDGVAVGGTVNVGRGEAITVQLKVTNLSGDVIDNIVACDTLGNLCYQVGSLSPGQTWTKNIQFSVPAQGIILEGSPSTMSPTSGIITGGTLRIVAACEAYTAMPIDPDPNPTFDADPTKNSSSVMRGGTAIRYFRVINYITGAPVPNATAKIDVTTSGGLFTYTVSTDATGLLKSTGEDGVAIPFTAAYEAGTVFKIAVVTINGIDLVCSPEAARSTKVTLKDFEYSTSYARGSSIEGSIGFFASVKGSAESAFELEKSFKRTYNGVSPKELAISLSDATAVAISKEVKVPFKFGFKTPILQGKIEAGVSASTTRGMSRGQKFTFPYPITPNMDCSIARISLESLYGVNPLITKLIDMVRTLTTGNTCTPPETYLSGISAEFSRGAAGSGSIALSAKVPLTPSDAENKQLAADINFGASGSTGSSVSIGFSATGTWDATAQKLKRTASSESYSLKGGIDYQAGVNIANGEIDNSNSDNKDEEKADAAFEFSKLKAALGTGGSTAESYSVEFGYDYLRPDFTASRPTSVSIGYAGPKRSGWKLELSPGASGVRDGHEIEGTTGVGINMQGPPTGSRKYDITDKDDVDYVLGKLANLNKIQQTNVGQQAALNLTMVPTVLQEEYGKFLASLQRMKSVSFSESDAVAKGIEAPLGGEITVGPFKLGLGTAVKADAKVGRLLTRGSVIGGRSWVAEKYAPSLYPAPSIDLWDSVALTWQALVGSFAPQFSDIQASVNPNSGPLTLQSQFTATMTIDTNQEPEPFAANLFSWRYETTSLPLGEDLQNPDDARGPAGVPHYGIGGFHQFGPDGRRLAADTPLVIDYRDAEVDGFDESQLAMYRWNTDRNDWDHIGGVRNAAANTVSTTVRELGLYTLGLRMPAGKLALAATGGALGDPGPDSERVFVVTSGTITNNDGTPVADGALFTVRSVPAMATEPTPYGTVEGDADPAREGVQVAVQGGQVTFTVRYPSPFGVYVPGRVVVYASPGTASGTLVLIPGE